MSLFLYLFLDSPPKVDGVYFYRSRDKFLQEHGC